ncbi:MAG: ThiF family adenylyltransferase [Nitrososphaerales archaeon]
MRITIVGVGALGSNLVQFIRNLEADLHIIDFDRVESKNILSQFHAKNTVGASKTSGLARSMKFLFGIKLEQSPRKLTKDNVNQLLSKADLIVDCVDNIQTRELIADFAEKNSIPCIHGALAPEGQFGRVVWRENFHPDGQEGEAATCEDGEHLPFIGIVSSYLAKSIQTFVKTGKKQGFEISPVSSLSV